MSDSEQKESEGEAWDGSDPQTRGANRWAKRYATQRRAKNVVLKLNTDLGLESSIKTLRYWLSSNRSENFWYFWYDFRWKFSKKTEN